MVGTNDFKNGKKGVKTAEDILKIAEQIQINNIYPLVVHVPPIEIPNKLEIKIEALVTMQH